MLFNRTGQVCTPLNAATCIDVVVLKVVVRTSFPSGANAEQELTPIKVKAVNAIFETFMMNTFLDLCVCRSVFCKCTKERYSEPIP